VRGLDVLVDEASAVRLAQSLRKTGGEPQEEAQLHRRFGGPWGIAGAADRRLVQKSLERLAGLVLENQRGAALMLPECERMHRPRRIELRPHCQLVFQHPYAIGPRTLRRGHRYEDRGRVRCRARRSDASPKHELCVLMEDLQRVTRQIHPWALRP
jgi:hypothetical protein